MVTPLTDSINALTQYANETTGKQDTTLSDAVGSLVEGYGQGGISTETFVITETYTNANQVLNAILSAFPTDTFVAVSKRDINTFDYNGIYCFVRIKCKTNNVIEYMIRYRNGFYITPAEIVYDVAIPIGDEYTVYILDSIDI